MKKVTIPNERADTRIKQVANVDSLFHFLENEENLRLLSIGMRIVSIATGFNLT